MKFGSVAAGKMCVASSGMMVGFRFDEIFGGGSCFCLSAISYLLRPTMFITNLESN